MAIGGDLDTMVAKAHVLIDDMLGGHADTDLVKIYDSAPPSLKNLMKSPGHQKANMILIALIADLLHRVWHLENP